ncbi:MAG: putative lipid II flippase FtsW [Gammaproteobacteria bacterium]
MITAALLGLGLVMVTSASIDIADRQLGNPFYYTERQLAFIVLGLATAFLVSKIRLKNWEVAGMGLLVFTFFLLALVLVPGLGRTVNGSTRWLSLGLVNLQVSELARLMMTIYLAGYLVRRGHEVRASFKGFIKPVMLLAFAALLLLMEPDFGGAVVLLAIGFGMLYLGGVRLGQFGLLILLAAGAMALLAISSPYRLQRLTTFLNPWADPFNSGFQLTQSLIAIGSGAWSGAGLGDSIQKLFYLPEAHNDFLFAVLAEELGLIGVVTVIALYAGLVWRAFSIGAMASRAGSVFGSSLAYGIGIWLGLQAFVNMGVNMGLLPTKGLTLPLMSAGGSSMIVMLAAIGFLQRVYRESQEGFQEQFGVVAAVQGLLSQRKKGNVRVVRRPKETRHAA